MTSRRVSGCVARQRRNVKVKEPHRIVCLFRSGEVGSRVQGEVRAGGVTVVVVPLLA